LDSLPRPAQLGGFSCWPAGLPLNGAAMSSRLDLLMAIWLLFAMTMFGLVVGGLGLSYLI
jgi:hypothetical protein